MADDLHSTTNSQSYLQPLDSVSHFYPTKYIQSLWNGLHCVPPLHSKTGYNYDPVHNHKCGLISYIDLKFQQSYWVRRRLYHNNRSKQLLIEAENNSQLTTTYIYMQRAICWVGLSHLQLTTSIDMVIPIFKDHIPETSPAIQYHWWYCIVATGG